MRSELPLNFSRLADDAKGYEELLARGTFRCFSDKHSASTDLEAAGADLTPEPEAEASPDTLSCSISALEVRKANLDTSAHFLLLVRHVSDV